MNVEAHYCKKCKRTTYSVGHQSFVCLCGARFDYDRWGYGSFVHTYPMPGTARSFKNVKQEH